MTLRVKAKQIYVEYHNKTILDIESLEIYDYDRIGIVGQNGSGKTTLLKYLMSTSAQHFGTFSYVPQQRDYKDTTLSGGEITRSEMNKQINTHTHGLFADEPTSHLDQDGIQDLIDSLKYYPGFIVVISHDRNFLDETVHKIWELKEGKIVEYWGNYSDYIQAKDVERKSKQQAYENIQKEKNRLEQAALKKRDNAIRMERRHKASLKKNNTKGGGRLAFEKSMGSKQKSLHKASKSIEKRLEHMEDVTLDTKTPIINFRLSKEIELHNPYPIMSEGVDKAYGDRIIFKKLTFQFKLGEKIAIIGPNGSGKSTLFKMIMEDTFTISPKAKIGYFSQQEDIENLDQTIIEFMKEDSIYQISEIRAVLASLNIDALAITKKLSVLSGGERMKMRLAKLLLSRYNILLLDEPTNYMDVFAIEALESLIKNYMGTVIFVTHDMTFINNVANRIYEINDFNLLEVVEF